MTDRCYNGGTIINYKVPSTGDRTDLRLWIAVLLIAFGGMCGIVGLAKRKKA
ncbi:MAG: hypothetical protein IJ573_07445 [Clostridia bacterium]|nr:hypothetical protein [Clostridia bacterium]